MCKLLWLCLLSYWFFLVFPRSFLCFAFYLLLVMFLSAFTPDIFFLCFPYLVHFHIFDILDHSLYHRILYLLLLHKAPNLLKRLVPQKFLEL